MKTIKLFLTLTLYFVNTANSQTYFSFPDSNAHWQEIYFFSVGDGFGNYISGQYCDVIGIDGDTSVLENIYHKLYEYSDTNLIPDSAKYIGGLREDSLRQIFFLEKNDTTECLLYDFNISLGDTFRVECSEDSSIEIVADAVDSILVGNSYRRKIHFSELLSWYQSSPDLFWIEGIGSSYGLFYQFEHLNKTAVAEKSLILFADDSIYYRPEFDFIGGSCYDYTKIEEIKKHEQVFIKAYPNPASETLIIEYKLPDGNEQAHFFMWDMLGNEVLKINLKTQTGTEHIELTRLSGGLYYYTFLVNNNSIAREKLVVIKK